MIDEEYYKTKSEQMKQVFNEYDVLGWYIVSTSQPTQQDILLHEQASKQDIF
jgi:transcriptional regulatory protein LevR